MVSTRSAAACLLPPYSHPTWPTRAKKTCLSVTAAARAALQRNQRIKLLHFTTDCAAQLMWGTALKTADATSAIEHGKVQQQRSRNEGM
jgi:hypothetical protein